MKKRYLFISIPIILMIAAYFFILPFVLHQSIVKEAHDFQPQSVFSFDMKYTLQIKKIEDDTGVYATFSVELNDTREEIFSCQDRYRTMDLKSISWGDTALDILVVSGDVGSILYQFDNGAWEKQ